MKNLKRKASILLAAVSIFAAQKVKAEEPIIVFLTDPDDPVEEVGPGLPMEPTAQPQTKPEVKPETQPVKEKSAIQKKLDAFIEETKAEPLTKKQLRIIKSIEADQKDFIRLLDEFVKTKFDPEDDEVVPEFKKIRDQIIKLTFKAPDEKTYYQRLYLINTSWLAHQNEALRYASLDTHLQDKWQEIEEHRRKIQSMVMTGTTILGAAIGGFFSYKASTKIFEISANTSGFAKIAKWGGRVPIVIFGTYVGAAAGRYAGFLGTDYILGQQRDFLNPIDGNEDLRDVLDQIDRLP